MELCFQIFEFFVLGLLTRFLYRQKTDDENLERILTDEKAELYVLYCILRLCMLATAITAAKQFMSFYLESYIKHRQIFIIGGACRESMKALSSFNFPLQIKTGFCDFD